MTLVGYRVRFSEPVTGFNANDIVVGGTALASSAIVTGSGSSYTVVISGMQKNGTVTISMAASSAQAVDGHFSQAADSFLIPITYSGYPTTTVSLSASQSSPTADVPVRFLAAFSLPVSGGGGFPKTSVTVSSNTGASSADISDVASGRYYTLSVWGMSSDGTIFISTAASASTSVASAVPSLASNVASAEYKTAGVVNVTCDVDPTQADPTNLLPILYKVVYSGATAGAINGSKIVFGGTASAGASADTSTVDSITHTIAVSSLSTSGTLTVSLAAGSAVVGGVPASPSTSTDNTVVYDITCPTVTLSLSGTQVSPTNILPIYYKAVFSEPMSSYVNGATVYFSGSASPSASASVTFLSSTVASIAVSGTSTSGGLLVTTGASTFRDVAGNPCSASTGIASAFYDITNPTVTVSAYLSSTGVSPLQYAVAFSESVSGFTSSDVVLSGTGSAGSSVTVWGTGTAYTISVAGMTATGPVSANIPANSAVDSAGNFNTESTGNRTTYYTLGYSNPFPSDTIGLWTFDLNDNNNTAGTTVTNYGSGAGKLGDLNFGTAAYKPTWESSASQYARFGADTVANDYMGVTCSSPVSGTIAFVLRGQSPPTGYVILPDSNIASPKDPIIQMRMTGSVEDDDAAYHIDFTAGNGITATVSSTAQFFASTSYHVVVVSWGTSVSGTGSAPRTVYGRIDKDSNTYVTRSGTATFRQGSELRFGKSAANSKNMCLAYAVFLSRVCSSTADMDSIANWLHYECSTVKGLSMAYTP